MKKQISLGIWIAVTFGIVLMMNLPLLYPLRMCAVFFHETSHALVDTLTGGHVDSITLDPREGGATRVIGGNQFLSLNAGYIGNCLLGAVILLTGLARRGTSTVAGILGCAILVVCMVWVRNGTGLLVGIGFGAALLGLAALRRPSLTGPLLQGLGLFAIIYGICDIQSDVFSRPGEMSDARMLYQSTGIPVLMWGLFWETCSLAILATTLYIASRLSLSESVPDDSLPTTQ